MSQLNLSIATTDYDHFRDFRLGFVKAEGIEHNWLNLGHHECFARFTANREFDLSELSFAKFANQVTRKMRDMFGGDPYPNGIEENRATWEQMALYTYQQGIAHRQFKPEEILPKGLMTKVVI